jgi:glycosyltransferase involved in cell wall biosynthesis
MKKNNIPRKLRVLFLSTASHVAGAEINLIFLFRTIDHKRFECHFGYDPQAKIEEYFPEVNLVPIPWVIYRKENAFDIAKVSCRLCSILLKRKIDVVYVNSVVTLKFILPIARAFQTPVIADMQSDETDISLRWSGIRHAKRLLFCSKALMEEIFSHSPWLASNACHVLHNAVDTEVYFPRNTESLRRELGLTSELPIIGIVGQVKRIKGHEIFLRMVQMMNHEGIEAQYLIVGDDNVQKGAYTKHLKAMAHDLGVEGQVMFLGYRKDIPEIMSLLDLITVPSLHEPFGRVVVEAMACGTPVVASRIGGMVEIFEDGDGGLFCDPNDADSLFMKVSYFFENRAWWERQKKRAIDIAKEGFGEKRRTNAIEEHLLSVVRKRC